MSFVKQTLALTATALRSIGQRRGSSLVTIVGVTTVVAVLASLLAMSEGASIFTGAARATRRGCRARARRSRRAAKRAEPRCDDVAGERRAGREARGRTARRTRPRRAW